MKIKTWAVNCNDAWLNTEGDDISGSYVKYKDHQEVVSALEAKCAALAAENSGLKAAGNKMLLSAISLMEDTELKIDHARDIKDWEKNKTPAIDSFLAEVRAQGVELFFDENPAALGNGNIKSLRENFLPKIKSGEIGWGDYLKRKDADLQEAAK